MEEMDAWNGNGRMKKSLPDGKRNPVFQTRPEDLLRWWEEKEWCLSYDCRGEENDDNHHINWQAIPTAAYEAWTKTTA